MQVSPAQIRATKNYVLALLQIRKSSPLFSMNSLNEVTKKLTFIDNDQQAEPGLIAMSLHGAGENLLVLFNSSRDPRTFFHPILRKNWRLHPDLGSQVDPALAQVSLRPDQGGLTMPGLTTLVLIESP